MEKNPIAVVNQEGKEVVLPFPLMKELIEYARKCGLSTDHSYSDYADTENPDPSAVNAVPLPEKFLPLVSGFPGAYFLVYYVNRDSDYYREGTRFKEVGISTAPRRTTDDERLMEVHVRQPAVSEGLGNVLHVEIEERVNEKSFTQINSAIGEHTNPPHGSAKIKYEVRTDGAKKELAFSSDRCDEGMFEWGGEQKHVRWVRNLDVDKTGPTQNISFRDSYLVGLRPEGGSDERADVRFTIHGTPGDPQSVLIEIGSGPESSAETLFEDRENNIKSAFS